MPNVTKVCAAGRANRALPADAKTVIVAKLAHRWPDGGPSDNELAHRYTQAGFPMGDATVNKHRNRTCVCYRCDPNWED